jgi:hypothetical protein
MFHILRDLFKNHGVLEQVHFKTGSMFKLVQLTEDLLLIMIQKQGKV